MPRLTRWLNPLALALYFLYLHAFYYVILVPAFADYSYYAFLTVPLALLGFWLVPSSVRKAAVVGTLLYFFVDQAITNVLLESTLTIFLTAAVLFLFLYALTRWYAKLRWTTVAVAVIVSLVLQLSIPVRTMQALPELAPVWISERQYVGEFFGRLPINVTDLNGDGKDDIVVLGNRDFYDDGRRKLPRSYNLYLEPMRAMAWSWQDGEMVRIPEASLDMERIDEWLPEEYIGFPYYVVNDMLELEPLVERIPYISGMIQFGTAPFRAMQLNIERIERQLALNGGVMDRLSASGAFSELVIRDGVLTGFYDGVPFDTPTYATQLSDTVRMPDGSDALLLKGYGIELLQLVDGKPTVTHTITRSMQRDLAYSNVYARDVDGDGADEVIIAYPYSAIASPEANGEWKVKWALDDSRSINTSFNIQAFSADRSGKQEILAFSKSRVRASQANYLTSFTYTEEGLKQNWKIFSRGIDSVKTGDLDGDGKDELIVTFGGSSNIYVFKKHGIPVTAITIILTALLFAGLAGRRGYDAVVHKRKQS